MLAVGLTASTWIVVLPRSNYPENVPRAAFDFPKNFAVLYDGRPQGVDVTVGPASTSIRLEEPNQADEGLELEAFVQVNSEEFPPENFIVSPRSAEGFFLPCVPAHICPSSVTPLEDGQQPEFLANAEPIASDTYLISARYMGPDASIGGWVITLRGPDSAVSQNPYRSTRGPYAYYHGPQMGLVSRGAPEVSVCYNLLDDTDLPLRVEGAEQGAAPDCNTRGSYSGITPQRSTPGDHEDLASLNAGYFYAVAQSSTTRTTTRYNWSSPVCS